MSKAFRSVVAACCMLGTVAPCLAADPINGKDIAKRWCASCHLIERGQTSATDQAPPFHIWRRRPTSIRIGSPFGCSSHIRTCRTCR